MKREELLVNAKPILFNTEMVKAILEDIKTVTRRVVKTELPEFLGFGYDWVDDNKAVFGFSKHGHIETFKAKYQVGDILYVRETWGDYSYDEEHQINYVYYRADYEDGAKTYIYPTKDEFGEDIICDLPKWKPSIHMPKEAARLFLKVTDIEVKRLNDISTSDCQYEGLIINKELYKKDMCEANIEIKSRFSDLWNSTINKHDFDLYGWEANPYVWVIEFERVNYE